MSDVLLIGFTGHKQAGKDTAYELSRKLLPAGSYRTLSFAAHGYNLLKTLLPLLPEGKEDPSPYKRRDGQILTKRHAMRELCETFGRSCYPDIWVDLLAKDVKNVSRYADIVFITDVRYLNEAKYVKSNGVLIAIDNPKATGDQHISETEMDSEEFRSLVSHRVLNDGTLVDFEQRLHQVLRPYVKDLL